MGSTKITCKLEINLDLPEGVSKDMIKDYIHERFIQLPELIKDYFYLEPDSEIQYDIHMR